MAIETERVVILGVFQTEGAAKGDEYRFDRSMTELDALTSACEMEPVGMVTQQLPQINKATYIGTGKLEEMRARIEELNGTLCVVNDTLTPTQLRNLQQELKLPVMDRTSLILEIFSKRARSREAKLQVELARLQYLKPRLIGMWETQNRQGGASGSMSSKGEGETQLELDRRQIDHRLAELRRELKVVERERETQRKRRRKSRLPLVSLIGYTNAGKSAIMNAMLSMYGTESSASDEKQVFEENMLFATLDTSIRKIRTGNNKDFMLSDTVGFVSKLPTALVEAFKSTLEEVTEADLLLHVVDYSDVDYREHMEVTDRMVRELGAGHIPVIYVYNKADACFPKIEYPRKGAEVRETSKSIYMCAKEASSIELLAQMITDEVYGDYEEARFLIPYDKGSIASSLQQNSLVLSVEYKEDGTLLNARCHRADVEKYKEYLVR
ncbi:MAG: GTPase HflX [Lachnospiraceae bacterium]|nr:GTPase HflX [Lachnospiraceae bacterium]